MKSKACGSDPEPDEASDVWVGLSEIRVMFALSAGFDLVDADCPKLKIP